MQSLAAVCLNIAKLPAKLVEWLIARGGALAWARKSAEHSRQSANEKESGSYQSENVYGDQGLEARYNAAIEDLEDRFGQRFPADYHAKLGMDARYIYDHGVSRTAAVDSMSSAIAKALQEGASISQAADAGAASIGFREESTGKEQQV
ncbi:hypothetical protein [Methylobacterium oxalidis]|uniref:Uncharacterized protein n=1 Tax=Methylobacterium oxalidis TaxID=944322 RepID=A0A512JCQ9_9HYPH|nr:hypothetical protein [Methylobacterium oxalidis]GEP07764.1 hypothetical protein MOX02_58020 [Methylobacterium oxalidis]GLS66012.1 hypothetical protein GCM10007888_43940 [Methylobacterium oxalidis]